MGNKQPGQGGGGGQQDQQPTATQQLSSSEDVTGNLYQRQLSKHKTAQQMKKELHLDEEETTVQLKPATDTDPNSNSNSNSNNDSTSSGGSKEINKASTFADDLIGDLFDTDDAKAPPNARSKSNTVPLAKKPKIKKKKKLRRGKVLTPSGYDLTPAVNATPDDHIIDGVGIDHVYESIQVIAEGGSCSVLEVREVKTGRIFALKQMLSDHKYNPSMYEQEIRALKQLAGQPNVLKFQDQWMDTDSLYLITEFCAGGSLLDKILSLEQFNEAMAARFIRCVLEAIAEMHSQNLIHRDLKPENIVFSVDPYGKDILKIIDFGDSITLEDGQYTTIYAGTRPYMAPQLFKTKAKQYFTHLSSQDRKRYYRHELKKADVWSVGVIAYVLVCGRLPFNGSRDQLPALICRGKFRWPKDIKLSKACKAFVQSLLVFDPKKRRSAKQALDDEWLAGHASKTELGEEFRATLREFNSTTKLTKLLVKTIWNVASGSERKLIKYGLKKITAESEGVLTPEQMFEYMMNFCHVNENDQFYVQCTANELRELMAIPDKGVHINDIDIGGLMKSFSIARDAKQSYSIHGGQLAGYAKPKLRDILEADDGKEPTQMHEKSASEKKRVMKSMIAEHNRISGKGGVKYDAKKIVEKVVDEHGVFDPSQAANPDLDIDDAEKTKKKRRSSKKSKKGK